MLCVVFVLECSGALGYMVLMCVLLCVLCFVACMLCDMPYYGMICYVGVSFDVVIVLLSFVLC